MNMENGANVDIRADIPLLEEVIYLDAASTTPTPKPVVEAMCDYFYKYNSTQIYIICKPYCMVLYVQELLS